jgi:hypothetical protein
MNAPDLPQKPTRMFWPGTANVYGPPPGPPQRCTLPPRVRISRKSTKAPARPVTSAIASPAGISSGVPRPPPAPPVSFTNCCPLDLTKVTMSRSTKLPKRQFTLTIRSSGWSCNSANGPPPPPPIGPCLNMSLSISLMKTERIKSASGHEQSCPTPLTVSTNLPLRKRLSADRPRTILLHARWIRSLM